MIKKRFEDKKMSEWLKISLDNSPKEILRRPKEIKKGWRKTTAGPVYGIKNLAI